MFKKLIAALKSGPGTNEMLDKIIGVFLLIVFFSMVYAAGLGEGRTSSKTELTNLAQLNAKIDRIQKIIDADHMCEANIEGNVQSKRGHNHG